MHSFRTALLSVWKGELGIRHISAYLKQHDYPVDLFFCPQYAGESYTNKQLEVIVNNVKNYDLLGISCATEMSRPRVAQIVKELRKKEHQPFILLGGNAVTFNPDAALKYANAIYVGEGEEATLDIIRKLNGAPVESKLDVLAGFNCNRSTLDSFPTVDYGFNEPSGKYYRLNDASELTEVTNAEESILDIDRITTGDNDPLFRKRKRVLFYVSSRGCAGTCAYCQSSVFTGNLRKRNVSLVIEDLEKIISKHGYTDEISFFDDDFFIRDLKELEKFAKEYKERIKLPFFVYASPNTLNESKLKVLIEAGKLTVNMGIQSGSERILKEVYCRRGQTNERVIDNAALLSKYAQKRLIEVPWFDFIVNNPWASAEEVSDDIRLVQRLEKPFDLHVHSLELLPMSPLYARAVLERRIKPNFDFGENPKGLLATAELQDFTEHINELQPRKHAYYTLLMYCLAGLNSGAYNGSIPSNRLDWLLEAPDAEKKRFLVQSLFENQRFRHYLQERKMRGNNTDEVKSKVENILRAKLEY